MGLTVPNLGKVTGSLTSRPYSIVAFLDYYWSILSFQVILLHKEENFHWFAGQVNHSSTENSIGDVLSASVNIQPCANLSTDKLINYIQDSSLIAHCVTIHMDITLTKYTLLIDAWLCLHYQVSWEENH